MSRVQLIVYSLIWDCLPGMVLGRGGLGALLCRCLILVDTTCTFLGPELFFLHCFCFLFVMYGNTDYFPIKIGLHQGSALSPYLFALVMDEVTRNIQGDIPWCMLFADDVVLVDESRAGVNRKLELWW